MLVSAVTALSLLLPTAVATTPAASVRALVAPAEEDVQVFASVKVDAEGFGEVGSKVSTRVVSEAETTLAAEGVKRRAGVDDVVIFIKVTPPPSGDEGYMLGIAASHLGQPIMESVEADCELCVEDELIELVDAKIREIVPTLRTHMTEVEAEAAAAAAAAAEANEPEPEPEPEPAPNPPGDDEAPKGMGGKGKAGAALVGVGATAAIAGVIMAVREPTQIDPAVGYELRSTKPPGYAALGVGAGLLITGAVLLALDSRDRKARAKKTSAVAPMLGPGVAGVSWAGRF